VVGSPERLVVELRIPAGWEESLQWLAQEAGFGPLLAEWDFPAGAVGDEAALGGRAADRVVLVCAPERAAELRTWLDARVADFGWAAGEWSFRTEVRPFLDDAEAWQARWKPFRCAGFEVLAPFHDGTALPHRPGCLRLRVEAGSAFGTGGHPTTRLGLAALRRWATQGPLEALLDVGTGSGILAVAAALLGAERVAGMDPDPESPLQAARMAARNGVAAACGFWRGTLTSARGGWPNVTANLIADLHADHAAEMAMLVVPGGRLYAGGIQAARLGAVAATFRRHGLEVERPSGHGRWRGLELRRRMD